jgi:hypothetical protein
MIFFRAEKEVCLNFTGQETTFLCPHMGASQTFFLPGGRFLSFFIPGAEKALFLRDEKKRWER